MRYVRDVCLKFRFFQCLCMTLMPLVAINQSFAAGTGSLELSPGVAVEYEYIDNLFYQPNNTLDTWRTAVIPSLEMSGEIRSFAAYFLISGEKGVYSDSSEDDYTDTQALLDTTFILNRRNEIQVQAGHRSDHDDRGTGLSEGPKAFIIDSPITFDNTTLDAKYIFGTNSSRGRLVVKGSYYKRQYTNFRSLTEEKSYENLSAGTAFFLRAGRDTRLLLEGQIGSIDYLNDPVSIVGVEDSLDRSYQKLFLGATWDATAKTRGVVKLGYRAIDFADKDRDNFSGPSWEIDVYWAPLSYSSFQFSSMQEDRESTGEGSFVNFRETRAEWNLEWTAKIHSNLFFEVGRKSFEDSDPNRADDLSGEGFSVEYSVRRWLDLGFEAVHRSVDSTLNDYDFDRNQFMVFVNAQL